MRMSGLLLLLVGLAIGLYLGFNPAAHRDLVRWWDRETAASRSEHSGQTGFSVGRLNSQLARSLRTSPKPLAEPGAQTNTVPTSNQIGDELHAFWLALERLWLSFLAQLHLR